MDTVAIPVGTKVRVNEEGDIHHGDECEVVQHGDVHHRLRYTVLVKNLEWSPRSRWYAPVNLEVIGGNEGSEV